MKRDKIVYWILLGFFGFSMIASAGMYFFDYQHAYDEFTGLGFPTWLIYPLGVAKVIGVVGLIQKKSETLRVAAYTGYLFNMLLAFGAHFAMNDGEAFGPLLMLVTLLGLFYFQNKVNAKNEPA
jgi:hypothetical protein